MSFETVEVDEELETSAGAMELSALDDYRDFFDEEDFRAVGIDPCSPTGAKPGSEAKVVMLAARYAAGLPLWHTSDCYDHGPERKASDAEEED